MGSIEKAHAVAVESLNEMEKMVEELIRKQKVKGEVKDWIEGVTEHTCSCCAFGGTSSEIR